MQQLTLDVAMNDEQLVKINKTFENLPAVTASDIFAERSVLLNLIFHRTLANIKHTTKLISMKSLPKNIT